MDYAHMTLSNKLCLYLTYILYSSKSADHGGGRSLH